MSNRLKNENPIVFVRNLAYDTSRDELYDLFGKFGAIRQIRLGNKDDTKGSAYIIYEEASDARSAVDQLSGFSFKNRYLVVLLHSIEKMRLAEEDIESRKEQLEKLKKEHQIE